MRERAPLLDLRGNTFAAKRWIPWAQRQLDRLKLLVGGNPVNKVFRPVIGTAVYVRSVGGNDFIRINVGQGGKYTCEFPNVVSCAPLFCSEFQLHCNPDPSHLTIGFALRTGWGYWENYHWDFGDGDTLDGDQYEVSYVEHEYAEAGEYTVSNTASILPTITNRDNGDSWNDALHKVGSSTGFPGTDAAAWAAYVASSGTTQNEGAFYWAYSAHDWQNRETYTYESQDQDMDFDLTTVDPLATCTLITALARLDTVVHYPNYGDAQIVVANGNPGIVSSLGVTAIPVVGGAFPPWVEHEIGDMTPFIGTVKNITLTQAVTTQLPQYMGGWPTPGKPPSATNRTGYISGQTYVKVETPGEEKTTTKVIKVNTGTPKKTRQIGESVHT